MIVEGGEPPRWAAPALSLRGDGHRFVVVLGLDTLVVVQRLGFVSMLGVRHVGIARRVVGLIFGGLIFGGLIFGGLIFRLGFRLLRGYERGGTPTATGAALGPGYGQQIGGESGRERGCEEVY